MCFGLARALFQKRLAIAPFKKGPDFIDALWLKAAANRNCYNLDTYLASRDHVLDSFVRHSSTCDMALLEGNRGVFDGLDAKGSHSTAELAKLIKSPVVLVVDTTKATRTIAASVLGCMALDKEVAFAGVILNRVGTSRQEKVITEAILHATGLPVLGSIPRMSQNVLPARHLGLLTAVEHPSTEESLEALGSLVQKHVDVERITSIAKDVSPLETKEAMEQPSPLSQAEERIPIGVLKDKAFSFYYPDNLEALEAAGADLVPISPLEDESLPSISGLYAGGGFPEAFAQKLSANERFRTSLKKAAEQGLPVWAECGGLMYLAESLQSEGKEPLPMVGAIPAQVVQTTKPQGHGYVRAHVDGDNAFLPDNTAFCGHEFHYSRVHEPDSQLTTVFSMDRGQGIGNGRDGIRKGSVLATYTHVHALGFPLWSQGLLAAARGQA